MIADELKMVKDIFQQIFNNKS